MPFISDSVNLLSPKQNLIKIPVISELQSIFLSSSFSPLPSLPLSPQMACLILPFWAPCKKISCLNGLCYSFYPVIEARKGKSPSENTEMLWLTKAPKLNKTWLWGFLSSLLFIPVFIVFLFFLLKRKADV